MMLDRIDTEAKGAADTGNGNPLPAQAWLDRFASAIAAGDRSSLEAGFEPGAHWRNVFGISWSFATVSGSGAVADALCANATEFNAHGFEIDEALLRPRRSVLAGEDVVEAVFRFRTVSGAGLGVVRLRTDDAGATKAWTLLTTLDIDGIRKERAEGNGPVSHARDFAEPGWLEQREARRGFTDRDPDVLIVGGGHAGISAAVELGAIGLRALIVDKEERVGDNWRLRYNGLKLHNKTPVNHLRYMPFPPTWPDYIPKDKLANWLEAYVDSMEIDFWTRTSFEGAEYDEAAGTWSARIRQADGTMRVMRPKHIVMATSVSGTPNIPVVPTIENFQGRVVHSSGFEAGEKWRGKSVVVLGTGTSAHDICQELEANGAKVTMVQRSPTLVVNVDPSAQLYDKIYLGEGPTHDVRDLLNMGVPLDVVKASHKIITKEVRALDADLLGRLEKAGFRLEFGEDDTGWPLKFRTRGGGYYFNVGCSDLIAEGRIALLQASDIANFVDKGIEMSDGSVVEADLVVLATGYKGMDHIVGSFFGAEVAERVGKIWNFDPQTQELRNMWMRTRQPGLWFTGGAFSQCRIYSRFVALQIDAIEAGRLGKAAG